MKNPGFFLLAFLLVSITSFSQTDSTDTATALQPLKVTSFGAKAVNKNVQLIWQVSGNEDAKSFEVERAEEGGAYQKVGSKLATGRTGKADYEFVDALPRKNTALVYRLKVIDKDGLSSLSVEQSIRIGSETLQCFLKQNPVRASVDVEIVWVETGLAQASILTAYGQKALTEIVKLSAGKNQISLSSQDLLPGLHRLVIEAGGERKVLSFVKE